ncbi:hypothetical protein BD626DRAFT_106358 [Schizophyllum amplum]|uniref:Uncharacterized protein n=1 Tax=Schizophyllum amplum TaxID=97359 RepID=A0A550CSN4_9AGAR|nr:hypothetical protein BD626DRAFT_106358 [Auriculariopsis ampla]
MDPVIYADVASSQSPFDHPNTRPAAAFFLGWVFLQSAHYMLETLTSWIGRRIRWRRMRSDHEQDLSFDEKHNTPSYDGPCRLVSSDATTFAIYPCFLIGSLIQTASLMTFGRSQSAACAFLIALFAIALQGARLLSHATLLLDLRRSSGIARWELGALLSLMVVGLGFFITTEAVAPGLLTPLSTQEVSVCSSQHFAPASSACSVIYILLDVYFVCRYYRLAARQRDASGASPCYTTLRASSLLLLELLILVPNAVPTSILGDTVPFSIGAVLVQAAFHWTHIKPSQSGRDTPQSRELPPTPIANSMPSILPQLVFENRPSLTVPHAYGGQHSFGRSTPSSGQSQPFSITMFPQPPPAQKGDPLKFIRDLRSKRNFSSSEENAPDIPYHPEVVSPHLQSSFVSPHSSTDSSILRSVENAVLSAAQKTNIVVVSASVPFPSISSDDLRRDALRNSATFRHEEIQFASPPVQPTVRHPFAYPGPIQIRRTTEDTHTKSASMTGPLESFWDDSRENVASTSSARKPAALASPGTASNSTYPANVSVVSPTDEDIESEGTGSPLSAVYGSDIIRIDTARDLTKSTTPKPTLASWEEHGSRRASRSLDHGTGLMSRERSRSGKPLRWPTLRTTGGTSDRWSGTTFSTQYTQYTQSSRSTGSMAGRLTRHS